MCKLKNMCKLENIGCTTKEIRTEKYMYKLKMMRPKTTNVSITRSI